MYLIDTDVISAGAPARARSFASVKAWMELNSERLFLSVITAAEIEDGIAKARREGARRKAADLAAWFETVLHLYGDKILPFDIGAARIAGRLSDRARGNGHAPGFADLAIAATAVANRLTMLTRNLRHFVPLGVPALDPFAGLPPD
ncbi:MAG: type II toxin-antitoxin system VapC family toxin [Stellaceae bacterium]